MYKTRQIIEIDVTWTGYKKLLLKWLITQLLECNLEVERFTVREVKRKR